MKFEKIMGKLGMSTQSFISDENFERRIENPYSKFIKIKNFERRIENPYSKFIKIKNFERGYGYEK